MLEHLAATGRDFQHFHAVTDARITQSAGVRARMEEKGTDRINTGDDVIDAARTLGYGVREEVLKRQKQRIIKVAQSKCSPDGGRTRASLNSNYSTIAFDWNFNAGGGAFADAAVHPHAVAIPVKHL